MRHKISLWLLICGLFIFSTEAQTVRNYSIQVTCKSRTYNSTQSILEFNWPKRSPGATTYYIYKKAKDRYDWGNLYRTVSASDSTFNDTITTGTAFEYMVEKYYGPDGYPTYGFIYAGHQLPSVLSRGVILLVLDTTHQTFLSQSLRTYQNDLIGDGWTPKIVKMSPSSSVSTIKSAILTAYNTYGSNLKTVVLIGDLAVAYSGNFSRNTYYWPPDGHVALSGFGPSHEGAWPCDLYYGSLTNSFWTDSIVTNTDGARSQNYNVPNDGKFDLTVLKELVKIQIGRIDLSNMDAFKNDVPDSTQVERELLKRYFTKNHSFRHKLVNIKERCLVDDNFGLLTGGTYNEEFANNAYRNMSPLMGNNKVTYNTKDYLTTLDTSDYLFSFGFGSGSYTNCTGIGSTTNFASTSQEIRSVFNGFMGSFFGDWDNSNNFLRAPLAAKGNVINSFWCGRPSWYLHHMGMGETIGYSTLRTQNNYDSFWSAMFAQPLSLYPNFAYFPFEIHPALMGDPAVRLQPVAVPENVQAMQDSCTSNFRVIWTAANDTAVHKYYIFRAKHIDSTFTLLGTTSGLIWKDNSPLSGDNVYMVRAEKLQVSGSGTYYNLSQGVFDTANISNYYEPLVDAGRDTTVCLNSVLRIGEHLDQDHVSYQWLPGSYTSDTISATISSAGNRILYATDTLTGCVQTDTVNIQTIALPSSETVSFSTDVCSDTVNWNSTSNNGNSYIYDWTFTSGLPADSTGYGLVSPGKVIYGTTGTFRTILNVTDTQTGCINTFSRDVDILCVGLSVSWANLNCMKRGKSSSIQFNIIESYKINTIDIEAEDEYGVWTKVKTLDNIKDGRYNIDLGEMVGFSSVRLNAHYYNGESEELDNCSWFDSDIDIIANPNPANGHFSLYFNDAFLSINSKVVVYNSLGLPIFETIHNFENGQLDINCEEWSKGIYTIMVSNSKVSKTIKIVR